MVAAAVGGAALAGSVASSAMSSSAAGKAADAQSQSAADANQLQRDIYEQNRDLLNPFVNFGTSGMNALAYRLGLGGVGPNGQAVGTQQTYDQIRQELLPQFQGQGQGAGGGNSPPDLNSLLRTGADRGYSDAQWKYDPGRQQWGYELTYQGGGDAGNPYTKWFGADSAGGSDASGALDEAGLEAAIQQRLRQQQAAQAGAQSDPMYGSLLDTYREYKPFSAADFQVDPGYAFRQSEGEKAIERMAAARGGLNSGRAAKDLASYNSGLASQEYQNAYGRYNNDYLTGFNAFNTNQNNIYNRLMGVTGVGQSSASAVAGVGNNYANQVSNNTLQAGSAASAGIVGQQNALNSGIGGVTNALTGYLGSRPQGTSGYSGQFQSAAGVPSIGSGQGPYGYY